MLGVPIKWKFGMARRVGEILAGFSNGPEENRIEHLLVVMPKTQFVVEIYCLYTSKQGACKGLAEETHLHEWIKLQTPVNPTLYLFYSNLKAIMKTVGAWKDSLGVRCLAKKSIQVLCSGSC